jgi:putative ABC transport system substrate-binding protein
MQLDQLKRREFITLLGGAAAAWPLAARTQQADQVRRIGVLIGVARDNEGQARVTAFRETLQALGWTEGRNVQFDERWSGGDAPLMQRHAKELVGGKPDVILVATNPALAAVRQETSTVPIVFAQVADPVGAGFAASAARPGGNITGFTHIEYAVLGKWLELLKEIAPHLTRIAVLGNPTDYVWPNFLRTVADVPPSLGFQVIPTGIRSAEEIEDVIDSFAREPNGGVVNLPTPTNFVNRALIRRLAIRHRLPVAYHLRFFTAEGGLMSYGVNNIDLFRRAASYVDRVLKGENPGDLPVQFPTKYELVINLKTAAAIGLDVPPTLLARADEVIE